jgi:hypothetical protein
MGSVETLSPAEELPALFRAVLDGVAELERLGKRHEAAKVRADAVRAYSRSWDASGRRRLEGILRGAERAIAETHRSGTERATQRVTSAL